MLLVAVTERGSGCLLSSCLRSVSLPKLFVVAVVAVLIDPLGQGLVGLVPR